MFNTLTGKFGGFAGGSASGLNSVRISGAPGHMSSFVGRHENMPQRTSTPTSVTGVWDLNPASPQPGQSFSGNEMVFSGLYAGSNYASGNAQREGIGGVIIKLEALTTMPVSVEMWGCGGSTGGALEQPQYGGGGGYVKGNLTLQAGSIYKLKIGQGSGEYTGIFLSSASSNTSSVHRSNDVIIAVAGGGGYAGAAGPPGTGNPGGGAGFPSGGSNPHPLSGGGGTQSAGGTGPTANPGLSGYPWNGRFLGDSNIGSPSSTTVHGGGGYFAGGGSTSAGAPAPGQGPFGSGGGGSNHSNTSFGNWSLVSMQSGQNGAGNATPPAYYGHDSAGTPDQTHAVPFGGYSGGSPYSPGANSAYWDSYANTAQMSSPPAFAHPTHIFTGNVIAPGTPVSMPEKRGGWGMGGGYRTHVNMGSRPYTPGAIFITLNES